MSQETETGFGTGLRSALDRAGGIQPNVELLDDEVSVLDDVEPDFPPPVVEAIVVAPEPETRAGPA